MSDFNNWNTPYKKPRMNERHPSGLKGKSIGLFYKNRHLRKNNVKIKKEVSVKFTMPPSVMTTMKKNIQTLLKTAQKENIVLPPLKQNYTDSGILSVKKESPEYHNDAIPMLFDKLKDRYVPTDLSTIVKLEPKNTISSTVKSEAKDGSFSDIDTSIVKSEQRDKNYSNIDTSIVKSEPREENFSDMDSSTVKSEPRDENVSDMDSSTVKSEQRDENYSDINTSIVKSEPRDENLSDMDCSTVKSELRDENYSDIDTSIIKSEPRDKNLSDMDSSTVKSEPKDGCVSETVSSIVKSEQEGNTYSNIDCSIVKSEPIDESNERDIPKDNSNSHVKGDNDSICNQHTTKVSPETSNEFVNEDKEMDSSFTDSQPCSSTTDVFKHPDFNNQSTTTRQLELRHATYKYGYEDIITGSFEEKLEEQLTKGIEIKKNNPTKADLNEALYLEYKDMIHKSQYIKMLEFRKTLPTYKKSKDILDAIENNQVVVISGETGCGKSTQVPQIILDDALNNKRGASVKILVTQPRRIAASSLATRVAAERAEHLGNSVGYAVRLEKVLERPQASIQYCTTGILLTDLEVSQSLGNFSHIILDEVHERDSHIDLAMCMLKQVLRKRKDLKLLLMSATIDSESLAEYFDNCLKMHIEGLAYPVKDLYLEDILSLTNFKLIDVDFHRRNQNLLRHKMYNREKRLDAMNAKTDKKQQDYLEEVGDWIESKKHEYNVNVIKSLKNPRVENMNFDLVVELIRHISNGQPGAILIFLPGFSDISKLQGILHNAHFRPPRFEIHSLHSKLPSLEQNKIFERPPNNIRKIIIATNIAETSITVDDIVYVIDCGRHKVKGLNVERNFETLDVELISKANLRQRRGRAGRCQPGVCYHLLTSYRASQLQERTLPELQRSNLLEPVLMIKRLRLGLAKDALKKVPSPPAESSIEWAVKQLQRCGALDAGEKLTPLGWHMARLPVHPAAGKLLLLGALFGCLDRAASVAAVWGFKDPFVLIPGKESEIDECKRNMTLGEPSDHVAISEAIINFEKCPHRDKRDFCFDNFLSNNTCHLLSDMKNQLGGNLRAMGFLPSGNVKAAWENRNANNLSLFKAIISAALYPNIGTAKWIGFKSRKKIIRVLTHTPEDGKVTIHPSSALSSSSGTRRGGHRGLNVNKPGANWLVYWMKQKSLHLYVFEVTLVYSLPLLFFGDFILSSDPETPDEYILDVSSIKVRVTKETADLLSDLRALLDHVLASKVMSTSDHSTRSSKFEEQVLNTIIELISAEDEQSEYVGEDLTESDYSENDNDSYY